MNLCSGITSQPDHPSNDIGFQHHSVRFPQLIQNERISARESFSKLNVVAMSLVLSGIGAFVNYAFAGKSERTERKPSAVGRDEHHGSGDGLPCRDDEQEIRSGTGKYLSRQERTNTAPQQPRKRADSARRPLLTLENKIMGLPRTFIGFSSTDIESYSLMLAWKAHEHIDFNFCDCQLPDAIDSENESYIKRVCRERIDM